jgi:hypothetical protein
VTPGSRALVGAVALLGALFTPLAEAAAQDTVEVRQDTLGVVPDTLAPPPAPLLQPIEEAAVPPGPLPPGSRYVFTRDSILWESANSLADLLATIPGVFVTRVGFLGLPEYVQYGGRGGTALEVYWDGVPWLPAGTDSVAADPGRIPLTYLKRVDVEVLPAMLRVWLVTERHERGDIRSLVRVNSGAFKSAAYTALFQRRWRQGLSLDLAGDYVGTDGPNQSAGSSQFDIWAKVGWLPSPRAGASFQIRRQQQQRDPVASAAAGTGVPAQSGTRMDQVLTLFAATRDDGLGFRADVGVAASGWLPDSTSPLPEQRLRQAYGGIRFRTPSWTADLRARTADQRVRSGVDGRIGWVPLPWVVVGGEGWLRRHPGNRTSRGARLTGGLWFGPVSVSGDVAWRDGVRAAALVADTAVVTTDRAVRAGLDTRIFTGHVRIAERDAFTPLPFVDIGTPGAGQSPSATYLEAGGVLRLSRAITISGWISDPLSEATADFQPQTHGRTALTLRSKYWRTFRSGIFDLKVRYAIESWSAGTAGLTDAGTPITLPGATFHEFHLEIQLGSFTAFWNLKNARLSSGAYVPGFPYPLNAQWYGVTWEFSN